ncbi:MAG: methylmalonyl-CoA mutase [candidate division Zixibacteria bacterium]|nr:methylmalonyl-CoA mutase [candidate division Zixibacteria bacterium]
MTAKDETAPAREVATTSGVKVKTVYKPEDAPVDYARELGEPGAPPFTRGIYADMYRGRLWTMRQYAGYATAAETNKRYRYLLSQGQTGLSVAFDLPTQCGYDSDAALARGEVGRTGVAISTLDDLAALFDGIPLADVSTSMTINATASTLLAMYVVLAKRRGAEPSKLRGTVQNDILKEFFARGNYIYPPAPSLRLATDLIRYCAANMPSWNSISISGYHIREAGATAAQEVAFTFADAVAYVEAALAAGLDVDDFAPRLSFFFGAHNDLLEEVAKFRAARRVWCRLMADRFGAKNPRSMMLRFHTQTAGCTLTAQQPANNVVRVALQALAAVLGGTQSLHTNSRDEALALPSEQSALIALRTQQIIAHESGVAVTADPLAGSYYVEALTGELEARVEEYLKEIDALGGALKAVESGYFADEIAASAYRYQKDVEEKKRVVVGVNEYVTEGAPPFETLRVDPALERSRAEELAAYRERRDSVKLEEALAALREAAAADGAPLMESTLACVEAGATVGEISDALREVWGEYDKTKGPA